MINSCIRRLPCLLWSDSIAFRFVTHRIDLILIRQQADGWRSKCFRNPALILGLLYSSLAISLLLGAAQGEVKYTIKQLSFNSTSTFVAAINNGGRVVGNYSWRDGSMHAFTYKAGVINDLGTRAGFNNSVVSLNNRGQMIGYYWTPRSGSYGYLRYPSGQIIDLFALAGNARSLLPVSINDCGVILGSLSRVSGAVEPFTYQNGQFSMLGTFAGQTVTPIAINNRGQILAYYTNAGHFNRGLIYSGGTILEIPLPPSRAPSDLVGLDINDLGAVVGFYNASSAGAHSFIFDKGKFQDLGTGFYASLNNRGQAVGSNTNQITGLGFATISDGVHEIDLNSLIAPEAALHLFAAISINDSGQIGGLATTSAESTVGFLLTPLCRAPSF